MKCRSTYTFFSDIVCNISEKRKSETFVDKIVRNDEKEDIGFFEKPVINQLYSGKA